jgi:hypothetical protein
MKALKKVVELAVTTVAASAAWKDYKSAAWFLALMELMSAAGLGLTSAGRSAAQWVAG